MAQFQAGETREKGGYLYKRGADGVWTLVGPAGGGQPAAELPALVRTQPVAAPEKPRDPPSGYNWGANGSLVAIPGGPADKPDAGTAGDQKLQENERTAAYLGTNLIASARQIAEVVARNRTAAGPSIATEGVRSVFGDVGANYIKDADRQIVEDAQLMVLDTALTLGTGAAYNREQLEGYRRSYFPQLGDKPEAIAAKQERLKAALAAARIKAGAAAPQIDAAIASLGLADAPASTSNVKLDPAIPFERQIEMALSDGTKTPEERLATALALSKLAGRPINPEDAEKAAKNGAAKAVEDSGLSELSGDLADATVNTLAGFGKGVASVVDIPANALAGTLGLGAHLLGYEDTAEQFRKPLLIGNEIEKALPTPDDQGSKVVRFLSELAGGAAALPSKATGAITNMITGPAPRSAPAIVANTPAITRDAADLAIPLLPADTGGPLTRGLTAVSAQTPIGGSLIARKAGQALDAGGNALRRIAGREGEVLNAESAGEVATKGALNYRNASRTQIGRLYDRAANVAEGARVDPAKTVAALDQNIAELGENPAGAEGIGYLTELRDNLVNKFPDGVTVQGIRGMRTSLRDRFYRDGLRGSDIERRVNEAVQSVSDDLADSLTAQGKSEAADIYRQADAAWAERVQVLDDFLMPIIGKKAEKSGEQVFQSLQQAGKSNGNRLREFLGALPEDEAGSVRATLINSLGKAKSGSQDAAGEVFSFDTFLTRWNDMGSKSRNALFSGEGREAIDKLARVAERSKASRKFANNSNTGRVVTTVATAFSSTLGLATLGKALAADAAFGLYLSSPKVANVLARIAESRTPAQAETGIKQLSVVAARNPALATELGGLQQRLLVALNDNVGGATRSVAAENETN